MCNEELAERDKLEENEKRTGENVLDHFSLDMSEFSKRSELSGKQCEILSKIKGEALPACFEIRPKICKHAHIFTSCMTLSG